MNVVDRTQYRIDHMRCPAIQGLNSDTVHILHKSMVEIVHIRRSVERTRVQVGRSWDAALDAVLLLDRLRREGF